MAAPGEPINPENNHLPNEPLIGGNRQRPNNVNNNNNNEGNQQQPVKNETFRLVYIL
jgi:hypothetical protein